MAATYSGIEYTASLPHKMMFIIDSVAMVAWLCGG